MNPFATRFIAGAFAAWLAAWSCAVQAAGFDIVDTQGHHHRLADYKGRWVVVNFWATWCMPCVKEIPELTAFAHAHPDVVVIGVALDAADADAVKRFAAKHGLAYPLVIGDDAVERQLGSQVALPVTRVYDPEGRVLYDRVGTVNQGILEFITRDTRAPDSGKA